MKIIYFIIFLLTPIISYGSSKNEIKNKLKDTNNIYFKFIQKIDEKIEKGECKISFPKKILCNYDDIHNKIMVSNGRSLIINSKKIKNYLNYKLKDTPLDIILDKAFVLKKIEDVEVIGENDENFFLNIKHNDILITIFFDKENYNIIGWSTIDMYQNKVETKLLNIKKNIMIDQNIFKIQKYIN